MKPDEIKKPRKRLSKKQRRRIAFEYVYDALAELRDVTDGSSLIDEAESLICDLETIYK